MIIGALRVAQNHAGINWYSRWCRCDLLTGCNVNSLPLSNGVCLTLNVTAKQCRVSPLGLIDMLSNGCCVEATASLELRFSTDGRRMEAVFIASELKLTVTDMSVKRRNPASHFFALVFV